jgi:hypothetical protein
MVARRHAAALLDRRGGVDVNVSTLAVVSVGGEGGLRATRIARTGADEARLAGERLRQRCRNRALQRSRRATNPSRPAPEPGGPEPPPSQPASSRSTVPTWSWRTVICGGGRGDWGRGIHAFTPGTLITALHRETAAVAALNGQPGLVRAGTWHTARTQHCRCGARVAKGLSQRRHDCSGCGLVRDPDLVAALLGAHTVLADPAVPGTARIDWLISFVRTSTACGPWQMAR